jgi:hypothetical protein
LIDPDELRRILLENMDALEADTVLSRFGKQLDHFERDFDLATPAAFDRIDPAAVRISAKRTESF